MEREKLIIEESVGSTLKQAAKETVESAGSSIREHAGEALGSAAESLRRRLPEGGTVGEAAAAMSRGAKHTADYIQEEGPRGPHSALPAPNIVGWVGMRVLTLAPPP